MLNYQRVHTCKSVHIYIYICMLCIAISSSWIYMYIYIYIYIINSHDIILLYTKMCIVAWFSCLLKVENRSQLSAGFLWIACPWVNYNDRTLFSLTGIMVRIREIIPKWPHYSDEWNIIIYLDTYKYVCIQLYVYIYIYIWMITLHSCFFLCIINILRSDIEIHNIHHTVYNSI